MPTSTPKPPAALLQHIREGRCILFAGAGLSMQAGLPSWHALLRALVQEVEAQSGAPAGPEIESLFERGKLLEIADWCKQELGPRAYSAVLAEQTRGADEPLSEAHKLVARTPFSAIVTTNYDHLLRRAFSADGGIPRTPTHDDTEVLGPLLFEGGFFILKAHGDIDQPESIVLTRQDYQQIIHGNPAFQAIFSALLLTKAVLFVGYSFNDPDFQLMLDRSLTLLRGYAPERYALMSGIGPIEAAVMRRTAGIRVIPYTPSERHHPEVPAFLKALAEQTEPRAAFPMLQITRQKPAANRSQMADLLREVEAEWSSERRDSLRELLSHSYGASSPPRSDRRPHTTDHPSKGDLGGTLAEEPPHLPGFAPEGTRSEPPAWAPEDDSEVREIGEPGPAGFPPTGDDRGTSPKEPTLAGFGGSRSGDLEGLSPTDHGEKPARRMPKWSLRIIQDETMLSLERSGPKNHTILSTVLPDWQEVRSHLGAKRFEQAVGQLAAGPAFSPWLADIPSEAPIALQLDIDLEPYPWEWLPVGGRPLCLRNALVRDPIGVSASARGRVSFNEPLSVLVIGDPGSRHPGARREAETVAELWRARKGSSVTTLIEDEATAERVTQELSTGLYDLIHFAGHAWADSEGAYLLLADEEPLRAASARSLFAARPPALLILNSHYTAFVPAGVHIPADPIRSLSALPASGHGRSGFIEAASLSGVASFVGCLGSVSDEGAARLGVRLHQELLAGQSVGQALLTARRELHQQKAEYGDDWRQFVLSGSGDLRLPPA